MGSLISKFKKVKIVDYGLVHPIRDKSSEHNEYQPVDPLMAYYYGDNPWSAPSRSIKEYDASMVAKLIRNRQLAPFYEGQLDPLTVNKDLLESKRIKKITKRIERLEKRKERKKLDQKAIIELEEQMFFKESWLSEDLVQCPICLLSYPRNINKTECCKQPICTGCFIQLKRPPSGRVLSCPFCVHSNFGIIYQRPRLISTGADSASSEQPVSVKCESIKVFPPVDQQMLAQNRRRQQQQLQRSRSHRSLDETGSVRRYIFYEPSGTFSYYDGFQTGQNRLGENGRPLIRTDAYEQNQLEEAIRLSLLENRR